MRWSLDAPKLATGAKTLPQLRWATRVTHTQTWPNDTYCGGSSLPTFPRLPPDMVLQHDYIDPSLGYPRPDYAAGQLPPLPTFPRAPLPPRLPAAASSGDRRAPDDSVPWDDYRPYPQCNGPPQKCSRPTAFDGGRCGDAMFCLTSPAYASGCGHGFPPRCSRGSRRSGVGGRRRRPKPARVIASLAEALAASSSSEDESETTLDSAMATRHSRPR